MTARKPLPVDLIDALLADYKKPKDLIGEEGLLKQLKQLTKANETSSSNVTLSASGASRSKLRRRKRGQTFF